MLEAIYAEPFSFRWRLLPLLRAETVEKKLKECVVLTDDENGLGHRTCAATKHNVLPQSTTSDFARRA